MFQALVDGTTVPEVLADLARGKLRRREVMEDATPRRQDDDLAESEHTWREVDKYLDYNWSRYRKYLYVAGMIRFAVLASILSFVVALTALRADVTVLLIIAALLYAAGVLEVLAIWTRRRQIDFYRRYTRD